MDFITSLSFNHYMSFTGKYHFNTWESFLSTASFMALHSLYVFLRQFTQRSSFLISASLTFKVSREWYIFQEVFPRCAPMTFQMSLTECYQEFLWRVGLCPNRPVVNYQAPTADPHILDMAGFEERGTTH